LIYSTTSPYSDTIEVWQQGKERTLMVEKYLQSVNLDAYNLESRYWGRVVSGLAGRLSDPKAILILGLGGGTIAHLLARRFPGIVIDGVEFDPVIVEVGKQFFDLDKIPNLQVITADAVEVVRTPKTYPLRASQYSMVIVDIFVGSNAPLALEEPEVIVGIKKLLSSASEKARSEATPHSSAREKARSEATPHSPGGAAVFNRLSKLATQEFRAKLEDIFGNVEEVGVTYGWGLPPGNILYFCS